ncbi:hypothetical protein [Lutibacter sp.]|uniref:hypothetical protein n=1 Tax=Lutibacter sp. TaxID=1925666 RepID=UPI0035616161
MPNVLLTVCLLVPRDFRSVGQFHEEFNQITDIECVRLLKEANDNFQLSFSK